MYKRICFVYYVSFNELVFYSCTWSAFDLGNVELILPGLHLYKLVYILWSKRSALYKVSLPKFLSKEEHASSNKKSIEYNYYIISVSDSSFSTVQQLREYKP